MRQKMMDFMRGRYGIDSFSNFLMVAACVIIFINILLEVILSVYLDWRCLFMHIAGFFQEKYQKEVRKTRGI